MDLAGHVDHVGRWVRNHVGAATPRPCLANFLGRGGLVQLFVRQCQVVRVGDAGGGSVDPWPWWRQSRRIFQCFIAAKARSFGPTPCSPFYQDGRPGMLVTVHWRAARLAGEAVTVMLRLV